MSPMLKAHCTRMKRLHMARARWEKSNGPGWQHKRERAVRAALYYRHFLQYGGV